MSTTFYLMLVPPGACILAAALGYWVVRRSAKEFDRKYGRDQS